MVFKQLHQLHMRSRSHPEIALQHYQSVLHFLIRLCSVYGSPTTSTHILNSSSTQTYTSVHTSFTWT